MVLGILLWHSYGYSEYTTRTRRRLRKQEIYFSCRAREKERMVEVRPDTTSIPMNTRLPLSTTFHSRFHPRPRHSHRSRMTVFGLFGNVNERTRWWWRRWHRKLLETCLVRR